MPWANRTSALRRAVFVDFRGVRGLDASRILIAHWDVRETRAPCEDRRAALEAHLVDGVDHVPWTSGWRAVADPREQQIVAVVRERERGQRGVGDDLFDRRPFSLTE